jgi:hypothetical protein
MPLRNTLSDGVQVRRFETTAMPHGCDGDVYSVWTEVSKMGLHQGATPESLAASAKGRGENSLSASKGSGRAITKPSSRPRDASEDRLVRGPHPGSPLAVAAEPEDKQRVLQVRVAAQPNACGAVRDSLSSAGFCYGIHRGPRRCSGNYEINDVERRPSLAWSSTKIQSVGC